MFCYAKKRKQISTSTDVKRQDFAGFALGGNFQRPATNFAIGRELLERHARVNHQFKALPAKRASDRFGNLHGSIKLKSSGEINRAREMCNPPFLLRHGNTRSI